MFSSKREALYASELELRKKAGEIIQIEYQPRLQLIPKPNKIEYVPDVLVTLKGGNQEYHEVKGMWTPVARLKTKLFHHFYPNLKLVIIE